MSLLIIFNQDNKKEWKIKSKKENPPKWTWAGNEIRTRDIHVGNVTLYHWAIPAIINIQKTELKIYYCFDL